MSAQAPSTSELIAIATEAVAAAACVADRVQHDLEQVRSVTKDDRSPVTVADFAVQAIVAMHLRRHLDEPLIVGEEHAGVLRQPDEKLLRSQVLAAVRLVEADATEDEILDAIDACDHDASAASYWTLDPIDGTKGFLRGQQYAIALGWLADGAVQLGVMGCPNLPVSFDASLEQRSEDGLLFGATRGEGAWQLEISLQEGALSEPSRIRVSPYDAERGVRVCESVEAAHSKQDDTARIIDQIGKAGSPARLDSQCKYAVVARGQADAYLRLPTRADYREKIWDHAAGMIIAAEAGAVVTDVAGEPLDFAHGSHLARNRGIVCAEPFVHERVIEAIARLGIA